MTGRCAGCGHVGSAKKVETHVLTCPQYIDLYHSEPDRCTDPAAEYIRYRTEDDTCEARAEIRDARLRTRFADAERQHNLQADRWRTPGDILAD